jgi:hypothetical protein
MTVLDEVRRRSRRSLSDEDFFLVGDEKQHAAEHGCLVEGSRDKKKSENDEATREKRNVSEWLYCDARAI